MKKDKIIKKIEETESQIKMFKKRLKTSDLCEEFYDNAILQKAILMQELKDCDKNPITESLKNGINKFFHKKEKTLICDYFK